jgi:hypothetical protein
VALVAKSPVASKAITISEIVKRRIGEQGGGWFQYTKLVGVMVDVKRNVKRNRRGGKAKNRQRKRVDDGGEGGGEEEGEEDPFRALEEKVPVKQERIPLSTIYISRCPIPELARLYGLDLIHRYSVVCMCCSYWRGLMLT